MQPDELPEVVPREGESIWAAAMRDARSAAPAMPSCWVGLESVTWAQGNPRSSCEPQPARAVRSPGKPFRTVHELLTGNDAQFVRNRVGRPRGSS